MAFNLTHESYTPENAILIRDVVNNSLRAQDRAVAPSYN